MIKIGCYTCVSKPFFQRHQVILYHAKKEGESDNAYVIKSIKSKLGDDTAHLIQHTYESAQLQREIATSSSYWAPIFEVEKRKGSAGYVTKRYKRSAKDFTNPNEPPNPRTIYKIVQSIIQGLVDLKSQKNRPHGNLKASNVLIEGNPATRKSQVVLSDPIPTISSDNEESERVDMASIGELIYELVHQENFPQGKYSTVHMSSENWETVFGDQVGAWQKLCRDLLFSDGITLETVQDRLRSLKETGRYNWKRLLILVGLVVAAIPLVLFAIKKPPSFDDTHWRALCSEYHYWFDTFTRDCAALTEEERKLWVDDPVLNSLLSSLESSKIAQTDPIKIAKETGSYLTLMNLENSQNQTSEAIHQTTQGLQIIKQVIDVLMLSELENEIRHTRGWMESIGSDQSFPKWPLLARITTETSQLKSLRWDTPVKYLNQIVKDTRKPTGGLVRRINKILVAKEAVSELPESIQHLHGMLDRIQKTEDPVLGNIFSYVDAKIVGADSLNTFRDTIRSLASTKETIHSLDEFVRTEWQSIDHEMLRQKSKKMLNSTHHVTRATLQAWLKEVDSFRLLSENDPRSLAVPKFETDLASIGKEILWLEDHPSQKIELFKNTQRDIERTLDNDLGSIRSIKKFLTPIEDSISKIRSRIDNLQQSIAQERSVYEIQPKKWWAEIQARDLSNQSVRLHDCWTTNRDLLLKGKEKEDLEQDRELFEIVKDEIERIAKFLQDLNTSVAYPAFADLATAGSQVEHKGFRTALMSKREMTLESGLQLADWTGGVPNQTFQEIESQHQWRELNHQFNSMKNNAENLMLRCQQMEGFLATGHLLEEAVPSESGTQTMTDFFDQIEDDPLLENKHIADALKDPIVNTRETLKQISIEKDREKINRNLENLSTKFVAKFSAWMRLWTLEWPDEEQDSAVLTRYKEALDEDVIGLDAYPERQALLRDIIDGQSLLFRCRLLKKDLVPALSAVQSLYPGCTYTTRFDELTKGLAESEKLYFPKAETIIFPKINDSQSDSLLRRYQELLIEVTEAKKTSDKVKIINKDINFLIQKNKDFDNEWHHEPSEKSIRDIALFKQFESAMQTRNPHPDDVETAKRHKDQLQSHELDLTREIPSLLDSNLGSDVEIFDREWRELIDLKLNDVTEDSIKTDQTYKTLYRNFQKIKKYLIAHSSSTQDSLDNQRSIIQSLNWNRDSSAAYAKECEGIIQDRLRQQTLKFFEQDKSLEIGDFAVETAAALKEAAELAKNMLMIRKRLEAGYTLDELLADSSIDNIYKKAKSTELPAQLSTHFSEIFGRIEILETIRNQPDIRQLLLQGLSLRELLLPGNKNHPEVLITVWRRLQAAEDWPRAIEEFTFHFEWRKRVKQLITSEAFADTYAERSRMFYDEFLEEGYKTWLRGVKLLRTENGLKIALKIRDYLALPKDTQLPDWIQFNDIILKYNTKDLAGLDANSALKRRDEIVTKLQKLTDLSENTGVHTFINQLNTINPETSQDGAESFGPGRFEWERKKQADANKVVFAKTLNGTSHSLEFYKLEPSAETEYKIAYIGTTEVPVGLIRDVIAQHNLLEQSAFRNLFSDYTPDDAAYDWRWGPRVWKWGSGGRELVITEEWLAQSSDINQYYPSALAAGTPAEKSPMQYISPTTATYVAHLLGCRLPTTGEWKAAVDKLKDPYAKSNLRGNNFLLQRNHIKRVTTDNRRPWPDDRIFIPANNKTIKREAEAEIESQHSEIDVLWFLAVNAGDGNMIHHLIGNVSEYVYDDWRSVSGSSLKTLEEIKEILNDNADGVKVIGGSSLSPPRLEENEAYSIDLEDAVDGYSDVGFRLLFTKDSQSFSIKLLELLSKQKLINKDSLEIKL